MDSKPYLSSPGVGSDTARSRPDPARATGASVSRDYADVPRVSGGVASLRQRESLRRTPPCSALVKSGSACLIPKSISDISLDGMFVELDSAGMVAGDIVELMLEFSDPRRTVDLQIAAEVVRVEANGVGLHFCDYGNQTYTDLVNLLYAR